MTNITRREKILLYPLMKAGCKGLAFFLVVVLLATRLGNYTHEMFVGPIQEYISQAATVCADEESPAKTPYLFKVKRLLLDVANVEQVEIVIALSPALDPQFPLQKFSMPPEVYLDIVVPPDEDPSCLS
jgi:hypothetical protein